MFPCFELTLPLPTSTNKSHTVGRGYRNAKGEWVTPLPRSDDYREWIKQAGISFRNQFPHGVQKMTGRLRVEYIFIWNIMDKGMDSSDIGNREKCLSDFLEKKLFENDKQIDEQAQWRRISAKYKKNFVWLRVLEIPDRRHDDPGLIFNPVQNKL